MCFWSLFLLVTLSFIVRSNETVEKKALGVDHLFQYLPTVCQAIEHEFMRNGDEVQNCLEALNGAPLAFNCQHMHELIYHDTEPFAEGTKKAAFFATFRGTPVVVKKPRESLLHGADPHVTAKDFRNEALLHLLLKSKFHANFIGHCHFPPINVVERLKPWRDVIPTEEYSWNERVDIALLLVEMLEYWAQSDGPYSAPMLHCDFYTFQFALTEDNVVDLDGLIPSPLLKDVECTEDKQCQHNCWRGMHYKPQKYGAFPPPKELTCGRKERICVGFDSTFNVFTVCRILFFDLFRVSDKVYAQHRGMALLTQLLDECSAAEPTQRPSLRRIAAKLSKMKHH